MPIRTTDEAVRGIVEVDDAALDPTLGLAPFIKFASRLVDRHCDATINTALEATHDPPYTTEELEEIERNLAAHFYASSRDPRVISETISALQTTYQMKTDLGLALTHFGQHAMMLDHFGGLAEWSAEIAGTGGSQPKGFVAGVFWGGKEYDDKGKATT
jgi:hypothetical protein